MEGGRQRGGVNEAREDANAGGLGAIRWQADGRRVARGREAGMKRRAHERVQGTNPHRLTVWQHVFPAASIARFAGPDGRVALIDRVRGTARRAGPDDQVFCARRVWDQRAEAGYLREIEDRFQHLAGRVIADPGGTRLAEDDEAASRFFALWRCRALHRYAPDGDVPLNGVEGEARTKDREERLESLWTGFIRPGGLPSRHLYGLRIQRDIDDIAEGLSERRWGVLALQEGELIVPDVPERYFIPLAPGLCLAWGHGTGTISGADARKLNRAFRDGCQDYWFCRTSPPFGALAG